MKNLAFIGCGHIHTPNFVDRVNSREDIKVKAVWDHDAERAASNATLLNTCTVATVEEIWQDSEIDSVVICSETYLHKELVLQAVAAKKNLFVEKPLGFSGEEAMEMAKAINEAKLIFQTGYFMRGFAYHRFIKEQIDAGNFGTITRVCHSNCHSGSLGGWFDTQWRWMADPKQSGCGAFGDLGTHSLDILMWMLGMPKKVTGVINTVTARYGDECDECGEAMLVFDNDIIGNIKAGWVDFSNPVSVEVFGTEGHAVVVNGQLFFNCKNVDGADGKTPWPLPDNMPHAFELYLEAINGKNVDLVSPQEAAQRNIVMSAIYKASANNAWQNIEA